MAVAGSRWPGNTGMDIFERRRLVGDAVILERAARILERRKPVGVPLAVMKAHVKAQGRLEWVARELRQEAASGE